MSGKRQTQQTSGRHQERQNINTGPWGPQQPFIQRGFGEAERLYNQGPLQYFPGQTYVDPSRYTMQGIQGLANLPSVQSDPLYALGSNFIGQSLGSVPQIGGVQDFIAAQMNPDTQLRAPTPGWHESPGPQIPGGGGGPMFQHKPAFAQDMRGGPDAFGNVPTGPAQTLGAQFGNLMSMGRVPLDRAQINPGGGGAFGPGTSVLMDVLRMHPSFGGSGMARSKGPMGGSPAMALSGKGQKPFNLSGKGPKTIPLRIRKGGK